MATRTLRSPVRRARRLEDGLPGRDQEGLPEARPRAPPGPEPRRQGGRGALQGDPGRLRHALGPREAQAVRRVRLGRRPRRRVPRRRRARRRRLQLRLRRHLGSLRRLRRHLRPQPRTRASGARRRPPGRGEPLLRGLAAGHRDPDPGPGRARLPRVRRLRRPAGHVAHDLPRVQGPRRHRREPGHVRALAPVPALRRQRDGDREAVPALPRQRPRAADEALQGQDPGRRQGRHADPPQGQGRARASAAGRRAT